MQTKHLLNNFLSNPMLVLSFLQKLSLVPMMCWQALVFYRQIQHRILTRRDTASSFYSQSENATQSQPQTMYVKHQI